MRRCKGTKRKHSEARKIVITVNLPCFSDTTVEILLIETGADRVTCSGCTFPVYLFSSERFEDQTFLLHKGWSICKYPLPVKVPLANTQHKSSLLEAAKADRSRHQWSFTAQFLKIVTIIITS